VCFSEHFATTSLELTAFSNLPHSLPIQSLSSSLHLASLPQQLACSSHLPFAPKCPHTTAAPDDTPCPAELHVSASPELAAFETVLFASQNQTVAFSQLTFSSKSKTVSFVSFPTHAAKATHALFAVEFAVDMMAFSWCMPQLVRFDGMVSC
jgi:hypothetical protein